MYDRLNRLRATVDPAANSAAIWTYDAVGNILSITRQTATQTTVLELPADAVAGACGVRILGIGFSATPSQNTVTVNGVAATVQSASATELVVCLGGSTTTGSVVVTTPTGSDASDGPLTVQAAAAVPTVTGFTPIVAVGGTPLGFMGTNFDPGPGRTRVRMGATSLLAPVSSVTATSLTGTVPSGTTSGRVVLTTPGGTATAPSDVFIPPVPYVASDVAVTGRLSLGASQGLTIPPLKQALLLFDGTAGQRVCIQNVFTAGAGTLNVLLYHPSGVPFPSGSATLVEPGPLPTTGTYQIQLRDADSSTTAIVTTTLRDANDQGQGTIPTDGTATALTFSTACYRAGRTFVGTAGQRVSLFVSSTVNGSTTLTLVTPSGSTATTAVVGNGSTLFVEPLTLAESGTYTWWGDPTGDSPGTLTLNLYDVPADVNTPISTGGVPVTAAIPVPGQRAALPFSGTAGQRASFQLDQITISSGSGWIAKPDGSVLGVAQGFSAGQVRYAETPAFPTTGTYQVVVDPVGAYTGSARVMLWTYTDVTGSLTLGVATPVSLTAPGQAARLTFTGTAGQRVTVQISNPSGSMGPAMSTSILKPDGTVEVAVSLGVPGLLGALTLPVDGTYTVVFDPAGMATGGFDVTVAASSWAGLTLAWNGLLRDRVNPSEGLGTDGALDGTLTATLTGGARTVQQLVLEATTGRWDTIPGNGYWLLGAAAGLDTTLLNAADGTVNFAVADGGSFVVFGTDWFSSKFVSGTTLTLTATFSDGTSAVAGVTVPPPPPPPGLTLAWNGKVRDKVGQGETALAPDGALDGTLTATLTGPGRTVKQLVLVASGAASGQWDTVPGNGMWVLGAAADLDAALLNAADGSVTFPVASGGSFAVFATDYFDTKFVSGTTLTLTATFTDDTTAMANVPVP